MYGFGCWIVVVLALAGFAFPPLWIIAIIVAIFVSKMR